MQINELVKSGGHDNSFFNGQPYSSSPFSDDKRARRIRDVQRTLFLRTCRKVEGGDFEVLYFLNLFGLKYILNDELQYATIMKDQLEGQQKDAEERGAHPSLRAKYQQQVSKIKRETEATAKLYEENETAGRAALTEPSVRESQSSL